MRINKGGKMQFKINYNKDQCGIDIEFDFETGMSIKLFLDDKSAKEMMEIIKDRLSRAKRI